MLSEISYYGKKICVECIRVWVTIKPYKNLENNECKNVSRKSFPVEKRLAATRPFGKKTLGEKSYFEKSGQGSPKSFPHICWVR